MQSALAQRMDQLVELGWEPHTTTETSASLIGRRPFSWWLFLLVIFFIPGFGGLFYLVFWLLTSRCIVFLHQEADQVVTSGDLWLVALQEARRESHIEEQRQVKERGFLAVMWPKLLVFLLLFSIWIWAIRAYF